MIKLMLVTNNKLFRGKWKQNATDVMMSGEPETDDEPGILL